MHRKFSTSRRSRHGFTLIELMMVIVIIAVLVSLLTVAVSSATKNARIASVRAEFSSINGALSSFQVVFGKYPPSQITLYEDPNGWNTDQRSKALIRSLWPQFNFNPSDPAAFRDINGDGDTTDVLVLTGAECLVFFLGGVTGPDGVCIGFSKNPANPFDRTGTNREGPYLETLTRPERLVDVDGDGMLEVLDSLPGQSAPIIYASSNNGTGYNKHAGGHYPDVMVYSNDLATPDPRDMTSIYFSPGGSAPLNPKSHQLISPGLDAEYGVGGTYDPEGGYAWNSARAAEVDNIISYSP